MDNKIIWKTCTLAFSKQQNYEPFNLLNYISEAKAQVLEIKNFNLSDLNSGLFLLTFAENKYATL